MALQFELDDASDLLEQLNRYMNLIVYEYALRREAGLEAKEAVRWSLRRVLPPPDGIHPVLGMIAGYEVDPGAGEMEVVRFLQGLILTLDKAWHSLQGMPGWSPGTLGMGW
jgi:hypothetical protein